MIMQHKLTIDALQSAMQGYLRSNYKIDTDKNNWTLDIDTGKLTVEE